MQNEANFPARAAERDRNGTHGSKCSRLNCDNGTNGQEGAQTLSMSEAEIERCPYGLLNSSFFCAHA